MADPLSTFFPGDSDNNLLRKILAKLGLVTVTGSVEVAGPVAVSSIPAVTVSSLPAVDIASLPDTAVTAATNPTYIASRTGKIEAKDAKVYHIMGRRAGFNSTSILQDVGEFLGLTTNAFPTLTGVETLEIVSSDANDTAAGTGARAVRVTYSDLSGNIVTSAPITLNGVTPVAAGFNATFIYWMEVDSIGTNTVSVGTIILRQTGPGATHEQISAGGNRSLSCRFKIPAGYKGYIPLWQATAVGNTATTFDIRLRATVKADRSLGTVLVFQDNAFLLGGSNISEALPWLAYPALCIIKPSLLASATTVANRIDSDFSVLLIKD